MKTTLITMLISTVLINAGCNNSSEASKEVPIAKSNITIPDGKLTPEVMNNFGRLSDPRISPDGKKILYGVSYTDIGRNKSNRELFTMNTDGSDNRQITSTVKGEGNGRWINSGNEIAYITSGEIWVMKSDGSGARKVSGFDKPVSEFEVSPTGDKILIISNVPSITRPADRYPDLDKATGRIISDLMYRHWDTFVEEIPHPFVADFNGNSISNVKDILEGEPYECPTLPLSGIEQLSWSPDGKYILYASRKVTGREYAYSTNTDIYLYDIESGKSENLTAGMLGYDTDPLFSPDGKQFAWISMERAGYEADKRRLFVMDLESRTKNELTTDYMYNVESITWLPDCSGLWFTSCVNALTGIYHVNIADKAIRKVAGGQFDFDRVQVAGDRLIATYKSMSMPNEIVSVNPADSSFTQISFENKHILDQLNMGRIEERWIKTVDNKDMHMWVVYPPGFDETKVYPALLFCTGGPQGTLSQGWSYRWNYQLMAAQGYIVILPNRRGTTAFGQEWCEQISGDYPGLNMQDYISSVKEMKKEKYVGKVGASGASYGGYSIYYLAGIHDGLFSAFASHAGIFNQEHMYMMTEELWFPHWDNGGAPWDDNPVAKRHYASSPHKLVKKWDTPILITHGELDYRVPVDQGMAAFNAAKALGVPAEMLLFPDENHWILKPQNNILWNRIYFEWFDKWLKN
ncbi:MAG: S9 family peptidase [Bacteroidales bacterium]|nr:S9 family peptidase [Bacteroidales bacterium]MDD2425035.1 S9 family peptidase [Bacteroidales bacterium]MDD3989324.1 S9 family peptidase [Bacteroidales bacterium]